MARLAPAPYIARAKPTLADYSQLLEQLERQQNPAITPEAISAGSGRRLWWRCTAGPDHLWLAQVKHRVTGSGCPFCAGQRASVTTSLAALAPELAREWHPSKNGTTTPEQLTVGSNARIWWRCSASPDHVWKASVVRRRSGHGCPFCAGKKVSKTNSLLAVAPEIATEWHPSKNGSLTPGDVVSGSARRVWWACPRGADHEWIAPVYERATRGTQCPFCAGRQVSGASSLAALVPHLAREWHPTKNGLLTPGDVTIGTPRQVWWQCTEGHEWRTPVAQRTKDGRGCPFCSHHRVTAQTSLAALAPELVRQWHPDKNLPLTASDVMPRSEKVVWWKCPEGGDHEWQATPCSRTAASPPVGCPFCGNRRLSVTNSLARRFPAIAREWHPQKNGSLTAEQITYVFRRKVWWRCQFGHEWSAVVRARTTQGTACPHCGPRKRRVATVRKTPSGANRRRHDT